MALTKVSTPAIKDEAITLAKLLHGDSNSNGKFLRANNGADPTFETVNTDLVSDTSPQLGGDLDTNNQNIAVTGGNNITMGDNSRLRLGASNDLDIYHDTSNSFLLNSTGNLILKDTSGSIYLQSTNVFIQDDTTNEDIAKFIADGAVELYHDNTKRFETESNGATVTGGRLRIQDSGNVDLAITDTSANAVAAYIGVKTAGYVEYNCYKSGVGTKYPHVFYGYTEEYARIDSAGIKFNGDTAADNALDDYEEGTWTPVIMYYSGGGWHAATMTTAGTATGKYTKIGNFVYISLDWHSWEVSNSNYALMSGLPFTSTHRGIFSTAYTNAFNNNQNQGALISINSTYVEFYRDNDSWNSFKNNSSGMYIYGAGVYMA